MSRHFILACVLTLASAGAAFAQSSMGNTSMAPAPNAMSTNAMGNSMGNSMAPAKTMKKTTAQGMQPAGTSGMGQAGGMQNSNMAPSP